MKKKLLIPLFSLATLFLTSCGGGNDGASTGTPVVAQATIAKGMCMSESCCPTSSETRACLLRYYPVCQLDAAYDVTNPSCVLGSGLVTVDGADMYGCGGGQQCYVSAGAGSSLTIKK